MSVKIGRYEVVRELGRGGMGIVFEGVDPFLGRPLAIKILPPKKLSDQLIERFNREARAVAILDHPNIIKIFDAGVEEDEGGEIYFIAMEYVDGVSLGDKIVTGPLPDSVQLKERLDWFCQVLRGMDYAHSKGVVHRDLKPDNIMVDKTSQVKIMDFGLAFFQGSHSLTRADQVMGTVAYFSPEQARGEADIDHRTDLYALGVILFELCSGQLPFSAQNPVDMIRQVLDVTPRSLLELHPGLPMELNLIVQKALRKNRDERFQTAGEMLEILESLLSNSVTVEGGQEAFALAKQKEDQSLEHRPQKTLAQTKVEEPLGQETVIEQPVAKLDSDRPKLISSEWEEKVSQSQPKAVEPSASSEPKNLGPRVICQHCGGDNPVAETVCLDCGTVLKPNYYIVGREAASLYEQGLTLYDTGDFEAAVPVFIETIDQDPTHTLAKLYLGRAYAQLGKLDEAELLFEEVLAKDPNNLEAYDELFMLYLEADDVKAQQDVLIAVLKVAPNNLDYRLRLAQVYIDLQAQNKAIVELRKVLQSDPENISALHQLGILYVTQGEYAQAVLSLQKVVGREPKESLIALMGQLYTEIRQYEQAENILFEGLEIYPDSLEILNALGEYYLLRGDRKSALEAFTEAVKLDPDNLETRIRLSDIYIGLGQVQTARQHLQAAAKNHPDSARLEAKLGELSVASGDFTQALSHFEKVVELNPRYSNLHKRLGHLYLDSDRAVESVAVYQKAIQESPVDAECREGLAYALYQLGDKELATAELQKAAMLDSHNPKYLRALAFLMMERKSYGDATRYFRQYLESVPHDAEARAAFGRLYFLQGFYNMAVTELESALKLKPSMTLLHAYLAQCYAKSGNVQKATEHFHQITNDLDDVQNSDLVVEAELELGKAFLKSQKWEQAEQLYRSILSRYPDHVETHLGLANMYLELDLPEDAKIIAEHMQGLPLGRLKGIKLLADIALKEHNWPEAVQYYNQLVQLSPTVLEYREDLGRAYRKSGDSASALKVFEEGMRVFPHQKWRFQWLQGRVYARQERWEEAYRLMNSALEVEPSNWMLLEDLGRVLRKMGYPNEALETLYRALEVAPARYQASIQSQIDLLQG